MFQFLRITQKYLLVVLFTGSLLIGLPLFAASSSCDNDLWDEFCEMFATGQNDRAAAYLDELVKLDPDTPRICCKGNHAIALGARGEDADEVAKVLQIFGWTGTADDIWIDQTTGVCHLFTTDIDLRAVIEEPYCTDILEHEMCPSRCGTGLRATALSMSVQAPQVPYLAVMYDGDPGCYNACDETLGVLMLILSKRNLLSTVARVMGAQLLYNRLKATCYQCCDGDGFIENCVKPIERWIQAASLNAIDWLERRLESYCDKNNGRGKGILFVPHP